VAGDGLHAKTTKNHALHSGVLPMLYLPLKRKLQVLLINI